MSNAVRSNPVLLVAGATGALGRNVVACARARGYRVRAMGRNSAKLAGVGADETVLVERFTPAELERCLAGVDHVFSCLGASVQPGAHLGYSTYTRVDLPLNEALIRAARAARVGRFVYVSTSHGPDMLHLNYVRAHEGVVNVLRDSGLAHAVIRPTGFFSAFLPILQMAKRGFVPLMGNPEAQTNPIDDRDLAEVCVDALTEVGFGQQDVGGPEVLTRRSLVELAFQAHGAPPRTKRLPSWLVTAMATAMYPIGPRTSDVTRFFLAVSSRDCVAPRHGSRTIREYYAEHAVPIPQLAPALSGGEAASSHGTAER